MFRRERPQKGRYRQFYQIGAEVLENVKPDPTRDAAKELAKDAITDAELIQMLMTFFDRLKLPGVNSKSIPSVMQRKTAAAATSRCSNPNSKK